MYHPIFPRRVVALEKDRNLPPTTVHSHIPSSTSNNAPTSPAPFCFTPSTYSSPQDLNICCKAPLQEGQGRLESHNGDGRCGADEMCVGSTPREQNGLFQACCISTDHFVNIVSTLSSAVVLDYCLILIDPEALLFERSLVLAIVRCCESLGRILHNTPRPALDPVSIFC